MFQLKEMKTLLLKTEKDLDEAKSELQTTKVRHTTH